MKTYRIEIAVTYSKVFEVQADSEEDAVEKLKADNLERIDETINKSDYAETLYNRVDENGCFVDTITKEW